MAIIKVGTGTFHQEHYPNSLTNSVHFSLSEDGSCFQELNQGHGVLFKKANIRPDNTLEELGCVQPVLTKRDDTYYIAARIVDAQGKPVICKADNNEQPSDESFEGQGENRAAAPEEAEYILWSTEDFLTFGEECAVRQLPAWDWAKTVVIPAQMAAEIRNRWMPVYAVSASLPPETDKVSLSQLSDVKASVVYSDGSVHEKRIDWDIENVRDAGSADGRRKVTVTGRIRPSKVAFPVARGFADPVIYRRDGKWYYIATNDNLNDVGLYVRCADSVDGLFAEDVRQVCILDYDEERQFCQTFWAPEFHEIGGRLYILFAVGGKQWAPQSHMMRLRQGGDIMTPADWETPVRVCRADGGFLTTDGITLDMTYFRNGEKSYLCWSYRSGIGTSLDTGSMLYLAEISEDRPWMLTTEPVLLSRPLYGWENISGTINNEGPYPLILGDRIYLAYSGGAAGGYSYAVGYLSASVHDDLTDPASWTKTPSPVLCSRFLEKTEGPGHNSFFTDEEGDIYIAYHAQEENGRVRCSAYHRVHILASGFPVLNVVGERDLPEHLRRVEATVFAE